MKLTGCGRFTHHPWEVWHAYRTMIMGTIGLIAIRVGKIIEAGRFAGYSWMLGNTPILISLIVTVILLLLLFRMHFIVSVVSRIGFLKKYRKTHCCSGSRGGKQLLKFKFIFFRYMVFILQYILLLKVMGEHSIPCFFLLLTLFYLVMAVAPTAGLQNYL